MTETKELLNEPVANSLTDPLLEEYGETTGSSKEEEEKVDDEDDDERIHAAGVTGAVVGLLAGPIGSVVLGFSSAYAAEQKEGPLGDAARSLGGFGLSTQQQVTSFCHKHHVTERGTQLYLKASEYDRIHNVMEKTAELAQKGWKSTTHFCQEKQVVQKGKDFIGKNVCNVLEKVVGGKDKQQVSPSS